MTIKYVKTVFGYRATTLDGKTIKIEHDKSIVSGFFGKFVFKYEGKGYFFGTLKDTRAKLESLVTID